MNTKKIFFFNGLIIIIKLTKKQFNLKSILIYLITIMGFKYLVVPITIYYLLDTIHCIDNGNHIGYFTSHRNVVGESSRSSLKRTATDANLCNDNEMNSKRFKPSDNPVYNFIYNNLVEKVDILKHQYRGEDTINLKNLNEVDRQVYIDALRRANK